MKKFLHSICSLSEEYSLATILDHTRYSFIAVTAPAYVITIVITTSAVITVSITVVTINTTTIITTVTETSTVTIVIAAVNCDSILMKMRCLL